MLCFASTPNPSTVSMDPYPDVFCSLANLAHAVACSIVLGTVTGFTSDTGSPPYSREITLHVYRQLREDQLARDTTCSVTGKA